MKTLPLIFFFILLLFLSLTTSMSIDSDKVRLKRTPQFFMGTLFTDTRHKEAAVNAVNNQIKKCKPSTAIGGAIGGGIGGSPGGIPGVVTGAIGGTVGGCVTEIIANNG